ncbi:MAG: hypothetical protein AB7Q15_05615 [Vicinamibacterales bacterium]
MSRLCLPRLGLSLGVSFCLPLASCSLVVAAAGPRGQRTLHSAHAALIEVDLCGQGLDAQGQALVLQADPGDFRDQALEDVVVQRVPFALPGLSSRLARLSGYECLLLVCHHTHEWARVEDQRQQGSQERAQGADDTARGGEHRLNVDRRRPLRWRGTPAGLGYPGCPTHFRQERGIHRSRVEDRLETPGGQILNLLRREFDPLLRDSPAQLAHDPVDVDAIDLFGRLGMMAAAVGASPSLAAATFGVRLTAALVWRVFHRHHSAKIEARAGAVTARAVNRE